MMPDAAAMMRDVGLAAALVAIWAWRSFHRPYTTDAVRWATEPARYLLGVAFFVGAVLSLQVAATVVIRLALSPLEGWWPALAKPWVPTADALLAALLVIVLLAVTRLAEPLRRFGWLLAGFPRGAEALAEGLRQAEDMGAAGLADALDGELRRFDVGAAEVGERLSPRIQALLCEVQLLHDRLEGLAAGDGAGRPAGFLRARADALAQLDVRHAALMRRSARAVRFLRGQRVPREEAYPVSDLLGEEALALLGEYRLAVAQAALSAVPARRRGAFLAAFGYRAEPVAGLPVWPVAAAFALDMAVFLVVMPLATALLPEAAPAPGAVRAPAPQLDLPTLLAIVALHALGDAAAVAWAVYPKAVTNFARPGIRSWPVGSYALFGLGSYVTAVVVSALAYALLPPREAHMSGPSFILGGSLSFVILTVALSALLDRRLAAMEPVGRGRWWRGGVVSVEDGLVTAAALALFDAAFRFVAQGIFGLEFPDWRRTLPFLVPLGFVLGAVVPGVAYSMLLRAELRDGGPPGPRPSSGLPRDSALREVAT